MAKFNFLFHIQFVSVETIQILDISPPLILSSNHRGGVMHLSFAKKQSPRVAEIGIRQFQPGDAAAFRRLNEEWITRFFRIEPKEAPILADPQATLLDSGGRGFFATAAARCFGCCALLRIASHEFEGPK